MSSQSKPAKPDMRRHLRILVPNKRVIRATGNVKGEHGNWQGQITVIGLAGMFIRTEVAHPAGTVLQLRLSDPVVSFEIECIVRNVCSNGVGVAFVRTTRENEQKLKTLLCAIKL